MIRLTDKADGHSLYLNPAAIESIGREPAGNGPGAVIRTVTSALLTVLEKPEVIVALIDDGCRGWPESDPPLRVPYRGR
ncbi:hypothetical protein SAMN02799625_05392 [Methylobacterium sp. UNC300MFChir4.1]|jgi:hypothetical protein|uniref:hypothetical protein n=1 Tax=Methylobacterium sp. UNC300MFChir4.1 TaxID=1502747 RepID=UPI0008B61589|nr:hypothetical protein [Methylobacterium sp. UNC300MFChir4.1]SEP30327.1 hypothetical protein SAMN02799625_05392 [Methylobacterium sp. UNC300MFChir4.1]